MTEFYNIEISICYYCIHILFQIIIIKLIVLFLLQADTVEHLENRMVAQESVIANVELRNQFSLHCLHMETQLVHAHLEILATVLQNLVSVQIRGHSEVICLIYIFITK
jgi:hypothetical protein